jgi:cell division protein FtsI/penicillin-binding protein 2
VRPPSRFALALAAALSFSASAADAAHPVDVRRTRITEDAVYAPIGPGGAEVKLTLDPHLQRAAERLLAHSGAHEGAIVASDVRTGRILAWASRGERDYVAEPFAPSASLFKIATAAALLEGGRVTPQTRECYEGGEHEIKPADLDRRGAACASLADAMGHSINLVIARLAKKNLSPADLRREAEILGFAGEVPIDVPVGASIVRIPDDPFGMARASAGFWNGQLSPLGGLYAMQTIANDGERLRFSIIDHRGATTRVSAGRAMSPATARALGRMLEITTRRGTAAKAFRRPDGTPYLDIPVSAKTGTLIGGARPRMYSWFAAFAPSTKPEIAITVMLGNDLRWHTKANIMGRELLEAYFKPAHKAVASAIVKGKKRR